jgi:hypothetical protein
VDHSSPEHACGFDRSQLYSDEGPPIGAAAAGPWAYVASQTADWVLRWNLGVRPLRSFLTVFQNDPKNASAWRLILVPGGI